MQSTAARKCGFMFETKVWSTEEITIIIVIVIWRDQTYIARGCGFVDSGSATPHGAPSERWLGDPAWDLCQHGSFSRLPWTHAASLGGPGCGAHCVHEQTWGGW